MTARDSRLMAARQGIERLGIRRSAVQNFLAGRLQSDGGFSGRSATSDLYYTAFGLDGLAALNVPPPPSTQAFVSAFGVGHGLDFMHVISLARCWHRLAPDSARSQPVPDLVRDLLAHLNAYACPGGGFNTVAGARHASATGNYLMASLCHDLGAPIPDPAGIQQSLSGLRTADGAYANLPGLDAGTALATAGVVVLQQWLGHPVDLDAAQWLLDLFAQDGGCLATPGAPVPDLLSTATALFAFRVIGVDTTDIAASCLAFVRGLQRPDGGFAGHAFDDVSDCEYTFYALIAMGCL